ncbi:hypothetical protein D9757_012051 [Collybiopsis confluens]|uniref:Uncharacterized protein n=1 Tax=Collybiopsis confluens TaxID=2823264 RepID=A0A8H5FWN3_9AGAR|nr:hypothetical protein D9757_012051 [Collybiopsis confluens]
MVKRKPAQKTVSTNPPRADEGPLSLPNSDSFPFAHYTSLVGVNCSLLVFVGLFFPQSTTFFGVSNFNTYPSQTTSRDRPQHSFLEPLTASPVWTLAHLCFGAIILQAWWSAWVRHWWIDNNLRGAREDKKMQKQNLEKKKLAQYAKAWMFVLSTSIAFHAILVVLGAPLISHVTQTYLLALFLAVLTVAPPAYTFGPIALSSDSESLIRRLSWTRLFAEFQIHDPIERAIVYPVVGAVLGSWLGVVPIALDWDRPWQAWPLTPAYGALTGYITGSMAALTVSAIKALADEHLRSLKNEQIQDSPLAP